MKKTLKLIPALAMLLVSAILVSTSTYAWFSMNSEVSAVNMQVRAVAEKGLLINEVAAYDNTNWDEQATANQVGTGEGVAAFSNLYPASTADGSTWYHGKSKKSNDAAGATAASTKSPNLIGNAYETLPALTAITGMSETTATGGSQAAFSTMGINADDPAGYYVHYTYYLKSAGAGLTSTDLGSTAGKMNIRIKSVSATEPDTKHSANLNKSLRVGIRMKNNGAFYIYNPLNGTNEYYVAAGATKTTTIAGDTATLTDLDTLPAAGVNGTPVEVYIWYEGEDTNCKSDNATYATLDNIKVDIVFDLYTIPSV